MKKEHCFLFLLLLASCFSDNEKKDTRTVFKYNEMGGITSLDPAGAVSFENIGAVNQLFDGLVQMDDSLKIIPSIARRWSVSDDGLTYCFYLNHSVFFHDNKCFPSGKGRNVTAGDFVYSFNRLLDARVSSATTLLRGIDNTNHRAFESLNDTTFIIHLQQPFTPFLGILTMKYFSVIPKEAIAMYGDEFRRNPVGTGPFQFKMWEEGTKMVFVKNNNYFEYENSNRLPYLDAVSITFVKDRETSFLNFLKGNTDMVSGIDAINTDKVLTSEGTLKEEYQSKFRMQTKPFIKTDYLGILMDESLPIVNNSPLKIKAIRQAINYGFDRKRMVKYLRRNLGIPATAGFIPPGLPAFDSSKVKGYDYNSEKAKQLLMKAGFNNSNPVPSVTLATSEQYMELAEYIQSQLTEIGFAVKIDVQKSSVLAESVANNKINFFRKSWFADYPDEENFLSLFYSKNWSPNGVNYTHYSNPHYDSLYEKSRTELNPVIRYEYYHQMDQLLMDDAPVIPLYYDEVVRLVQNNISNFKLNSVNLLSLKAVKKK